MSSLFVISRDRLQLGSARPYPIYKTIGGSRLPSNSPGVMPDSPPPLPATTVHYHTVSDFVYNPIIPTVRILRRIRTPNLTSPHNGDPLYGVNTTDEFCDGLGYEFRHLEPNAFDDYSDVLLFGKKRKLAECQAAALPQKKHPISSGHLRIEVI